jgi:type III secretion protein J
MQGTKDRRLRDHRTADSGRSRSGAWRHALLALLACLLLAACGRTALYSNLDEQQANELMAALLGAGISADKSQTTLQSGTGWEVRVSQGDFPRAMQVLAAHRLPRERYVSMCETFKKEGFASSAIEERARYQCSLERELAHTLSGIPGVAEARVHVALPERDPLGNETADSSAAVTIYEEPGANVRDRETDIKVMVKDSIEGLDDPNKVTVKFYTLGTPQAARPPAGQRLSVAGFSPVAIAIAAGALALLALLFTLLGRSRARAARAAQQAANGRVWNG